MPRIPLVAVKGFAYNHQRLTKGDAFEALTAADAHVLTLTRMARKPDQPDASDQQHLDAGDAVDVYFSPETPPGGDEPPNAIPSPKRSRGRPKKYQTAALTPDDK